MIWVIAIASIGIALMPKAILAAPLEDSMEGSVSIGVEEKAAYGFDPGRAYRFDLSLPLMETKSTKWQVDQGLSYKESPYKELRATDTYLRARHHLADLLPWNAFAGARDVKWYLKGLAWLGHSKASTDAKKRGGLGTSLEAHWQLGSGWRARGLLGARWYSYEQTLTPEGQANDHYALYSGGMLLYSWGPLLWGVQHIWLEVTPHEGWAKDYRSEANLVMASTLSSGYTASILWQASDHQLREGRERSYRPLEPKISTYTFSIERPIQWDGWDALTDTGVKP